MLPLCQSHTHTHIDECNHFPRETVCFIFQRALDQTNYSRERETFHCYSTTLIISNVVEEPLLFTRYNTLCLLGKN